MISLQQVKLVQKTLISLYGEMRRACEFNNYQGSWNKRTKKQKEESFHYIPSYPSHLQIIMDYIWQKRKLLSNKSYISICDYGCGDGLVLLMMKSYIETVLNKHVNLYGIDFDNTIKPVSRDISIDYKNFFSLPIDYSGKFDIIYTYNPLRGYVKNMELLVRIQQGMRPDSQLIFSNASIDINELKKMGFSNIQDSVHVYLKK